jgi:hypothetical protein
MEDRPQWFNRARRSYSSTDRRLELVRGAQVVENSAGRPRVFLSYTHSDRAFAERLAIDLTRAGVQVWFDEWEIRAGESIVERVGEGLEQNDYLLVLLSPASVRSAWVRRELNSSVLRSLQRKSVTIIPVMQIRCVAPSVIEDLRYADFTQSYQAGFVEVLASLGLATKVPAYSTQPRRTTDLELLDPTGPVRTLFPRTFNDWPRCLLDEQGRLDVSIVVGSTIREKSGESSQFNTNEVEVEILGTNWRFSRQSSPGTVRDLVRVVDLAASLVQELSPTHHIRFRSTTLCVVDIAVSSKVLEKNLILVGAADTNIWFALASIAYRQKYGYSPPIRYSGDDRLYFTCDQIQSDLSGTFYPRLKEYGYMHCGYLMMLPNPWAQDKILVLASGTRATGTQAALLALVERADTHARSRTDAPAWHRLESNNRFYGTVPAKVVRATHAEILHPEGYFEDSVCEEFSPYSRI